MTWIGAGALALAVALVLRAPAWGAGAALLVTVGAIDAGPGWGALALAACSVGVALVAVKLPAEAASARTGLQAVAALAGGGALVELGRFLDWSMTGLATAGLLLAALATIAGLVLWATRPDLPWAGQAGRSRWRSTSSRQGRPSPCGRIALRSSGCSCSWRLRRPAPASSCIAERC